MAIDFLNKYREILISDFNVTQESFDSELKTHIEKRGDGNQSKRDFIWRCFNEILTFYSRLIKDEVEMYQKQKQINMVMWEFLQDEGRDIKKIRKQVTKLDLLIAKARDRKSEFVSEIHFIANNCCPECDKLDKKILPIDEAIEQQLLPNPNCTRENGCICCYSEMMARDENTGRLKKK